MTSRRRVLGSIAAFGLAGLGTGFPGFIAAAQAQTANIEDLMVPGPMSEMVIGSSDAKVTIIEYASLTCGHCASFHTRTWPELKKKYVDTGKVRFVLREFPLDPLAMAGFMLARCAGGEKQYAMIDLLFEQQRNWAFGNKPLDALMSLSRQAGFTQESFEACLKNQSVYDAVEWVRKRASDKFGVSSTPTFFINGRMERGALSLEEFEKIIEPLLRG
jgi:protein-disulfide isomerase